jgi:hypothetical protein
MFISPSAFGSGSFLTAANISVVGLSVRWGAFNPAEMTAMGLSIDDIEGVEGTVNSGQPITESAAVDTFKLVYAADRNAQLPRGTVNDTLARLTLMAGPQKIGSSIRGLASYPQFARDFKSRYRDIVNLARNISLLTYIAMEQDDDVRAVEMGAIRDSFGLSVGQGDFKMVGIPDAVEMAMSDRSGSLMDIFREGDGLDGWHLVKKF